jgi:outer membrane protein assembly factor BamB
MAGRAARLLPLSALATLVAVAVIARVERREAAPPGGAAGTGTVALTASSSMARAPLDRPLVASASSIAQDGGAFVPKGTATMHGHPRRMHRAAARGPTAARVAWQVSVGGPVAAQVTTSPDERTLYVATLSGHLLALARDSGKTTWDVELGERAYGAPLVHEDGTIYVGSDAKKLVAASPQGNVVFRLELDGEVDTSPVFAKDGTVIVAAGKSVVAVRRGGDVAWRFAAKNKVYASPAIDDDGKIVFGSQDDHVYALAPGGALAWTVDLGADVDGGPAIGDDGSIHVGTDKGEVVQLDRGGHVRWRTSVGGFVRGSLAVARNGDVLAGTYGPVPRVVRLAADGAIVGAFAVQGTGAKEFGIHGAPLEDAAGALFFGAQDDAIRAIGPDGALRFRFATRGDVDAPLTLLGDGSLVVPSEDGSVTLLLP